MIRRGLSLLCLLCVVCLSAHVRADDKPAARQVEKRYEKGKINYLLFLPEGYEKSDKTYPMILFLHGAGERGDDLKLVKKHGPAKIVETKKDFPFIVVSPQEDKKGFWSNSEALIGLVDEVIANNRVDKERVYLTGLSMGGFGTWKLAAAYPNRFAAIVPICGGGDPKTAAKIKDLPIWVFHGSKDTTVKPIESEKMIKALEEAGGKPKYTAYPNAGHDSWTETYNNPELYKWLLEHKIKK